MSKKIAGNVFLSIFVLYAAFVAIVMLTGAGTKIGVVATMVISEGLIALPALVAYAVLSKKVSFSEAFGFRKIRFTTVLAVVGYALLIMPLGTLMNVISMLVVDNVFADSASLILGINPLLITFIMAVYGPVCEELTFRGILMKSLDYEQAGWKAIVLSSFAFGLMHMNLNQFTYAFVMGMGFAVIMEATRSIWSSIICHMLFNGMNLANMLLINKLYPGYYESQAMAQSMTRDSLLMGMGVYMIVAAVTTTLAIFLLKWIANREGNPDFFKKMKGTGKSVLSPLFIVAIILYVAYIGFDTYSVIMK